MLEDLLQRQYQKDNYKVIDIDPAKRDCYVFFTSSGLWNNETFEKVVSHDDKYEWENISKSALIQKSAGRLIFVRDVYKHFYVDGINAKVDSVLQLVELLQSITEGYRVVTIGNSSGGYMAMLAGRLLKADRVISFGGVFSLYHWGGSFNEYTFSECAFFTKYLGMPKSEFYDIRELLKQTNDACPIFHFYSADSVSDVPQIQLIQNMKCGVFPIAIKGKTHGKTILSCDYPYVMTYPAEKMLHICQKTNKEKISCWHFSCKYVGVGITVRYFFYRIIKKINSILSLGKK